ncbi:MAG: hypothetical protein KDC73_06630 [Ignavibacteriae bacterium]|nr:hypothetical protein [Ignavibacteriota bacterium]MCB9243594.1 hypothetical protein [Ignavibacteriales bacterium]
MSLLEFHKSTTAELISLKNRVRNLVNHFGEDGRHKEVVLKSVIKRFLPEKFKIGSGFVVKQTETRGIHLSSMQIDIIIYDSEYPVLFKDGDFVILTIDSVRAIIEVKTNVETQDLTNIILKATENGKFIYINNSSPFVKIFNGIFAYEGYTSNTNIELISSKIRNANSKLSEQGIENHLDNFRVNTMCFNKDILYKFWEDMEPEENNWLYNLKDMAFSYFISNLLNSLKIDSILDNSNIWFPVDKGPQVVKKF